MKIIVIISLLFISSICNQAWADQQSGLPIDFVGGCEVDLNADGNLDMALLINTTKGYDLIVLMRFKTALRTFIVADANSKTFLSCHYGKKVKGTDAGPGKRDGKIYKINGAYLKLTQPETSSSVYFWSKDMFKEVWLSD